MSKRLNAIFAVLKYLEKIYPKAATEKEIWKQIGMSSCTCSGALRTLKSRGSIEVTGKKGRANLYKFNRG